MKLIEGGICAVRGVKANGIKQGKNGLAIIITDARKRTSAGVFTRNKVIAAPLIVTQEALLNGELKAVIANSGCANAFTGKKGMLDARWMAKLLAEKLKCGHDEVGVASTGVIGRYLDKTWIEEHLDEVLSGISNSKEAGNACARAIMTTDTFMKEVAVELDNGVCIGGIAKGSGMIEPDMGTMLAFLYTDASLSKDALNACLKKAVDRSFNMVVVDGDTSTNDMALCLANGMAGNRSLEGKGLRQFEEMLDHVCTKLSRMIVMDGEGATKLVEVRVMGARGQRDAEKVGFAVANSSLVKTALFACDPNWGRIMAAIGYSGAYVREEGISVSFDKVQLVRNGAGLGKEIEKKVVEVMRRREYAITIDLNAGRAGATVLTTDLTYDYVKINVAYRS